MTKPADDSYAHTQTASVMTQVCNVDCLLPANRFVLGPTRNESRVRPLQSVGRCRSNACRSAYRTIGVRLGCPSVCSCQCSCCLMRSLDKRGLEATAQNRETSKISESFFVSKISSAHTSAKFHRPRRNAAAYFACQTLYIRSLIGGQTLATKLETF